ncbi:hypothetical protein BDW62DRAFT_39527 [Aspergillus aurantiobrunneus]
MDLELYFDLGTATPQPVREKPTGVKEFVSALLAEAFPAVFTIDMNSPRGFVHQASGVKIRFCGPEMLAVPITGTVPVNTLPLINSPVGLPFATRADLLAVAIFWSPLYPEHLQRRTTGADACTLVNSLVGRHHPVVPFSPAQRSVVRRSLNEFAIHTGQSTFWWINRI